MDVNELYKKIFPIGSIDDNNRYLDMTGDKINVVQLVEPSLAVDRLELSKKDKYDKNNQPDKYAYRIPIVAIDGFTINRLDISAFKLDYTGFLPTVMLEFVDSGNDMLSTNVVKDGAILKVYIGGNGDELYYKPIRQDFIITSVKKNGGGAQNYGGYIRYRVYGKLNIPYGYRKEPWCSGKTTAMQSLFNLAIYTGLGFATNFTKTNTLDSMVWINNESETYFDFMQRISGHACYSPNTFFTSFIDQYNILNFVECHTLLSHGGKKTDVPAMMYKAYPPETLPEYNGGTKTTKNQLPLKPDDEDLNNSYQKLTYYYLSNNEFFSGWSNFIDEYTEITNGGSSISDGFKCHVGYSDSNRDNWGMSVCQFNIRPIDNLKRNSSQVIESLPEEPVQSSYIPLNLIQMTKKDYQNGTMDSVDDVTSVDSYRSFGEVNTSNMFKQYYFAEVQNDYQMKCMKKCGLKVTLQNYNPSVIKFSRVWVDIYDKNMQSNMELTKKTIYDKDKIDVGDILEYKNKFNDYILKYDDEGVIEDITDENRKNKNWPRGEFNRALSGWYVVTEIEIIYSPEECNLKMKLTLNRIEYQPCYKSDYTIAQKAVEIYKTDNTIDNLIVSKDDPSYMNYGE